MNNPYALSPSTLSSRHQPWSYYKHPLFILSWTALIVLSYFYLDQRLAEFVHQHYAHTLDQISHFVTLLGKTSVNLMFAGLLLLCGTLLRSSRLIYGALFLLIALVAAAFVCDVIKIVAGRARPTQWFLHGYYGFYFFQFKSNFWSFPSGHSTIIATTMTALSLQWPRYRIPTTIVLIAVSTSRIILQYHYLSDVLTGILLGSGLTLLLYHFVSSRYARFQA